MSGVDVYAVIDGQDVRAGTLYAHRRRSAESATFSYDVDYLAMPGAYSLDPGLPLHSGAHQTPVGRKLFGAFSDCAPDRWGRTLLDRRAARLARAAGTAAVSLGELDYLLGVRDDLRQGALRFRTDEGFLALSPDGVPALTDLPELLDLAVRAERDTADLPDLQRLVKVGSSLGGARPKAHVRAAHGRIAIAKFPSANDTTWSIAAWEKVALDLAAAAGIRVPVSHLLDLAGRWVIVVDRFDRTADGGRIGYVSAMTMLEATDGVQRSYLEIAEVVENYSANAGAELRQLWRRIVFSILISNTDDYLRNHGFLHTGAGVWELAPAFDLNPDPRPGPKFLSTAIDERDDRASVALALTVADYFRLDKRAARRVLSEVASAVDRWRDVARSHRISGSEIEAMQAAFGALTELSAGGL